MDYTNHIKESAPIISIALLVSWAILIYAIHVLKVMMRALKETREALKTAQSELETYKNSPKPKTDYSHAEPTKQSGLYSNHALSRPVTVAQRVSDTPNGPSMTDIAVATAVGFSVAAVAEEAIKSYITPHQSDNSSDWGSSDSGSCDSSSDY